VHIAEKMAYIPYIPNMDHWKDHFSNPSKKTKSFYTLKKKENVDVKLVTPTAQAVEQAKSLLKKGLKKAVKKKPKRIIEGGKKKRTVKIPRGAM
jgi:hypothetical protein